MTPANYIQIGSLLRFSVGTVVMERGWVGVEGHKKEKTAEGNWMER